jgi:hypothetical protein
MVNGLECRSTADLCTPALFLWLAAYCVFVVYLKYPKLLWEKLECYNLFMETLLVKTKSLPKRCEICHKADRFNPQKNYCSRCSKVIKKLEDRDISTRNKLILFLSNIRSRSPVLFEIISDLYRIFMLIIVTFLYTVLGLLFGAITGLLIGIPISFISPIVSVLIFILWNCLFVLIGFIYGVFIGIKTFFKKQQVTDQNLQIQEEPFTEGMPYWRDSKNRLA